MIIPEEATRKIYNIVNNIMTESQKVTDKMDNNMLIPPIGMSLENYFLMRGFMWSSFSTT